MSAFGDFLYTLRKEKGMTQAELAKALGVTNKAVSKWETGEAMPETSLLLPLSRIFGVTVNELLEGKRANETGNEGNYRENHDEFWVDEAKKHLFTRGKDDEKTKTLPDYICEALCATVVLSGIFAYVLVGILTGAWHPWWVIIPVCALSCGIIGIIFELFNKDKRRRKLEKGENPLIGAICGFVMLVCIITYLLLGASSGLWHPLWVIVIAGVVFCGVFAPIGNIIVYRRGKK